MRKILEWIDFHIIDFFRYLIEEVKNREADREHWKAKEMSQLIRSQKRFVTRLEIDKVMAMKEYELRSDDRKSL